MITKMIMELVFLTLASYMLYIDRDKGKWLTTLWSILIIYFLSWALADLYIILGGHV